MNNSLKTCTITGLTKDTVYYFYIKIYLSNGLHFKNSNTRVIQKTLSADPTTTPTTPTTSTSSLTSIPASWNGEYHLSTLPGNVTTIYIKDGKIYQYLTNMEIFPGTTFKSNPDVIEIYTEDECGWWVISASQYGGKYKKDSSTGNLTYSINTGTDDIYKKITQTNYLAATIVVALSKTNASLFVQFNVQ